MDVDQLSSAEVEAGVEIAVVGLFDHRAEHDVDPVRQTAEFVHGGALEGDRTFRYQVLEEIAGQTELGENQQLDARGGRLSHPLPMALEIAIAIAEGRVHLNQPDREPAILAHA